MWVGFKLNIPLKRDALTIIMVMYSFVPVVYCLFKVYRFAYARNTYTASILVFILWYSLFHFLVIDHVFQEIPPRASCHTTCTSASGRCGIAISFLVLHLWDGMFRLRGDGSSEQSDDDSLSVATVFNKAEGAEVSPKVFAVETFAMCCLMLPVPVAAVSLHDRTLNQVGVGCFVGLVQALFWKGMMRQIRIHFPASRYPTILGLSHKPPWGDNSPDRQRDSTVGVSSIELAQMYSDVHRTSTEFTEQNSPGSASEGESAEAKALSLQ
jgi:hypothetical protein